MHSFNILQPIKKIN